VELDEDSLSSIRVVMDSHRGMHCTTPGSAMSQRLPHEATVLILALMGPGDLSKLLNQSPAMLMRTGRLDA
jgi:hypothetical protein